MHRHEMQQSNIYLGIYIIEYYFFWKNQGVTPRNLMTHVKSRSNIASQLDKSPRLIPIHN
jgi:hypothetical protein